jgi:hypothetical protein
VEVTYAGQSYRLGRYPIHFHLNGDLPNSYVRGCSIHNTFNRAINIHGTNEILVEHNVGYNIMGGAFFLEDSIEMNNVFQYNFLAGVKASSSLLTDDITPAAFWITHPTNTIQHNHVAGGTHFGFWYRMHEHPIGPSYTTDICPRKAELGVFNNNTVHSVGWYGLWVFEYYDPMEGGACDSTVPKPAVFQALTAWNNFRGAEWVECGAMQFVDFIVANNYMSGMEALFLHEGVEKYTQNGALMKDSVVIGHLNGADHPPCTRHGIVLPFGNGLLIDNVKFINFDGTQNEDHMCAALGTVKIICVCLKYCSAYNYKFQGIEWINSDRRFDMEWEMQIELEDSDGSLTGQGSNSRVYAKTGTLPPSCVVRINHHTYSEVI